MCDVCVTHAPGMLQHFYMDSGREMSARLGPEGYPITNHVTNKTHMFPPRVFAAFVVVMLADFSEQVGGDPLVEIR